MSKRTPKTANWRRLRLRVLDRDGWRCRNCGRHGRLEVDHIIPLEQGGSMFDMDNLQALCRDPCHFAKTRGERTAKRGAESAAWEEYLMCYNTPN